MDQYRYFYIPFLRYDGTPHEGYFHLHQSTTTPAGGIPLPHGKFPCVVGQPYMSAVQAADLITSLISQGETQ